MNTQIAFEVKVRRVIVDAVGDHDYGSRSGSNNSGDLAAAVEASLVTIASIHS